MKIKTLISAASLSILMMMNMSFIINAQTVNPDVRSYAYRGFNLDSLNSKSCVKKSIECERLQITSNKYSETEDLNAAIQNEFGGNYLIADWNDLKAIANLDEWISCMELEDSVLFMVTRNGEYLYEYYRQYFVGYFTGGSAPPNWLVHEQIENKLFLGSWYEIELNILAKDTCSSALCISDLKNIVACRNDDVQFEIFATGIFPIQYQWQKNGLDIADANDSILFISSAQPEDNGNYRCIISNELSIDTSNTALLTVEYVTPETIFGLTAVKEYQVATYSVMMSEGHYYEFMVEGGNKIDGTQNSITVHWGDAGTGYIRLLETNELGCLSDTIILEVSIGFLNIEDNQFQSFKVYPNPFKTSITIAYYLSQPQPLTITFFNQFGELVDRIERQQQSAGPQQVIWTPDLPPGIYYFTLQAGDEVSTGKVVKISE